jgi:hypothetical protein
VMCIRIWLQIFSLCMIMAVLLSGCLGVKTPPVSRSTPPGIFVDYQRTGGIAGVNDRVVIFDNGVTVISSRSISTEITLNQTDLDGISTLFNENEFSALNGNFTSLRGGADFMRYSITYKGKMVQTEDTAVPSSLQPIIEEMNRILARGLNHGQTSSALPSIPS